MYRVELKVDSFIYYRTWGDVPNVPCGVESRKYGVELSYLWVVVPNVPCGVERPLKASGSSTPSGVPNVPCGVERQIRRGRRRKRYLLFLMYRVELKADRTQTCRRNLE